MIELERDRSPKRKERYFTPESIDRRAHEMLQQARALGKRHPLKLRRPALLVLDMQRYFLEESSHAYIPSAHAIIPRIKELIAAFSDWGLPVVFTRHLNLPEDAGQMAEWWRELITAENPLSEIIPELDTNVGMVIEKSQYDAFYKTPLEEILKRRGVSQVVISGVMTHLCCETTARSAFVRGFEVFFTVNGTATYNAEFHRATLLNLAHGFGHPVLSEEIIGRLRSEDGR